MDAWFVSAFTSPTIPARCTASPESWPIIALTLLRPPTTASTWATPPSTSRWKPEVPITSRNCWPPWCWRVTRTKEFYEDGRDGGGSKAGLGKIYEQADRHAHSGRRCTNRGLPAAAPAEQNASDNASSPDSGGNPFRTHALAGCLDPRGCSAEFRFVEAFLFSLVNRGSVRRFGRRRELPAIDLPLYVHVILARRHLNVSVQVGHFVLCPFVDDRSDRNAIHLYFETPRSSNRDAAMIQFEHIVLQPGHRFGLDENRRSVQSQVRRRSGLGFHQVSGKNGGRILGLVAVDPHSPLRVKNPCSRRSCLGLSGLDWSSLALSGLTQPGLTQQRHGNDHQHRPAQKAT